jgi:hypothetical protein
MGDILSLKNARKARERLAKEATAAENRVRFGRTKDEKRRERGEAERAQSVLDGHRRDDDGSGS